MDESEAVHIVEKVFHMPRRCIDAIRNKPSSKHLHSSFNDLIGQQSIAE